MRQIAPMKDLVKKEEKHSTQQAQKALVIKAL